FSIDLIDNGEVKSAKIYFPLQTKKLKPAILTTSHQIISTIIYKGTNIQILLHLHLRKIWVVWINHQVLPQRMNRNIHIFQGNSAR
ncbi:MAG TPA: hypothetical protein DCF44_02715, partial [Chitinophagaceae bacterium]|nr:hypothetical protein [Chitinophagaceae bacterium]